MDGHSSTPEEPVKSENVLLGSLTLSRFAIQPPFLIVSLLLLEIGDSYGFSVGITGQLRTAAALVAAISALLTTAISVRVRHKQILLMGLFVCVLSALGSSIALNFPMLLAFFSLAGLGFALVDPMVYSLVGAHFTLKKRAKAIGWILTGAALPGLIGTPIINMIAKIGGWRSAFLGFGLPVVLISLVLALKIIPLSLSTIQNPNPVGNKRQYSEGFQTIFSNKSATACLIGTLLSYAAWQAIVLYSISLFRERFLVSLDFATLIIIGTSISFILGSQTGRFFINWFGRKPVTVSTALLLGLFTIFFTRSKVLWISLACLFLATWLGGVRGTSANSLTLEQDQQFRGSIMSLNSSSWNLGVTLGAGLGGIALIWVDYEGMGLVLGVLAIAAAFIYQCLVVDPTNREFAR
jgi:predicted MFS family arabinose efflux permease